jgi:hypothetical protein
LLKEKLLLSLASVQLFLPERPCRSWRGMDSSIHTQSSASPSTPLRVSCTLLTAKEGTVPPRERAPAASSTKASKPVVPPRAMNTEVWLGSLATEIDAACSQVDSGWT